MDAEEKTEQIILRILWAGFGKPALVLPSGLPPLYYGTLPPPPNPKGQPVRSANGGGAGCLASAVLTFNARGVPIGAGFASGPFSGEGGEEGQRSGSAPFSKGFKGK